MTWFDASGDDEGVTFIPRAAAASRWTGRHLRGPAIVSLLARAVEGALPDGGVALPARTTFDLHSPVPLEPYRVRTRVVKRGRSLSLVDAELHASDRVVARCRSALLTHGSPRDDSDEGARERSSAGNVTPTRDIWADPIPLACAPPPAEVRAAHPGRLFRSATTDWSPRRADHRTGERMVVWYTSETVVDGETASPFQLAAAAADLGNFVVNFGASGLAHINSDVTLSLARLPVPGGVGVCGGTRIAAGDVAVGTALVFDTRGVCGQATVTAVRHAELQLTFEEPFTGNDR